MENLSRLIEHLLIVRKNFYKKNSLFFEYCLQLDKYLIEFDSYENIFFRIDKQFPRKPKSLSSGLYVIDIRNTTDDILMLYTIQSNGKNYSVKMNFTGEETPEKFRKFYDSSIEIKNKVKKERYDDFF